MPCTSITSPNSQVLSAKRRIICHPTTEPIGSAVPKFSQDTRTLSFIRREKNSLSLLCPAQASPLPAFRFVRNDSAILIMQFCVLELFAKERLMLGATNSILEWFSVVYLATGAPKTSFRSMSNFTLFHLQEPIGGAKPKFSSAIDGLIVRYALRQFIAITCPAQGFPLPGFRLVN